MSGISRQTLGETLRRRIRDYEYTVEQVAELVGFSDYSAFYRAFKGEFGISPRQFRIQTGIQAERQSGA